jgi:cyclophilin family peptidyl-prolyl cis-trans isomerase
MSIRDFGEITIKLFPQIAPLAVQNFIDLSESGYYEGKIFHRIIANFMIQGGSPFGDGMSDHDFQGFATEPSPYALHLYGAISTANTGSPNSNAQQFFIVNTHSTPHLDGNHTVFGHTVNGFEVLDAISALETDSTDRPLTEVVIERITIHTYEG